ncbi:FtsQ-type POTRA domain-containing protein [Microbacterium sp. STN6]|uniref:FtsQ-type POTRA domain-containing protein n=1 Tax=Microbacterium sp. STN6 TaxID=2995588 RepID=UPI002260D9AD|nr:FtsQ-type POTRA domain-containing protein [Microbacterium sp. STN6]MCX7521513.1 FtsQ-type POTRA domain-containing protein [Microbacterium sp. STN6]
MKRPSGFDPARQAALREARRRGSTTPGARAGETAGARAGDTAKAGARVAEVERVPADPAGNESEPTTEPIPIQAPATSEAAEPRDEADAAPPPGGGRSRSAGAALRAARRERRRYERGEVRRFTRRSRHRRLAWLIGLGSVVLVVLLAFVVSLSPLMAVRTIDVTGVSGASKAAVEKALDGQLGRPLPLVDFGAIRAKLAAFPAIRSYTTESRPPGTLVVRIVPRTPVGIVTHSTTFDLVDAAGVVLSSSPTRPEGYPTIAPAPGTSGFEAVVSVLEALPASVLTQVDTATATTRDDATFTMRGTGATVVWGSGDDSELKADILAKLLVSAPSASRYDLSSPHNVVLG